MLATNQTFLAVTALFAVPGCIVWLAPRPKGAAPAGAAH